MSLGRLIAQLLVVGTSVVSKAFVQAYQQAVLNAGKHGGAKASAASLSQALSRKIHIDEARKILNVSPSVTKEQLEESYKRLFEVNDVNKGGSFYLQSKIYRARECIDKQMALDAAKLADKAPPSSP
ncbi:Presequence translocated-associated motor subunit PAM16 [Plasmodiophora brassicae]|uniref:Presequence translocated-associated motor subunit PAM16 n=1 Tax=Plasmodiophora brassicae TaxID=37360 RepID=A0A0G4IL80_PLABS|nr:hypothetical protein PBRA_004565 [Plasmodiophora brassicae]SPR00132.1 unnamed protein product [Plasmodiophora brassicae]